MYGIDVGLDFWAGKVREGIGGFEVDWCCSCWTINEKALLIAGGGSMRRTCERAWLKSSFNPIRKYMRYSNSTSFFNGFSAGASTFTTSAT